MSKSSEQPHVVPVEGYPVVDIRMWQPFDAAVALAHYLAGYALLASGDPSELERALGYLSPQGRTKDQASEERGGLHVFARALDGSPARLDILDGRPDLSTETHIGQWLDELRPAAAAFANGDVSTSNVETGETSPPGNAWTKIGSDTITVVGKAKYTAYTFEEATEWSDAGVATATINVYRLNSVSSYDYFLVKTNVSSKANYTREDRFAAFFWTTSQAYQVSMVARTAGGGEVQGRLFQAEPKSVPGSTDYKMNVGSELNASVDKDGIKGGGKVTASMETTWRVNDVNAIQTIAGDVAGWQLEFPVTLIRGIHAAAKGLTTSTYAIFEFPRTINDGGPPTIVVSGNLSGAFATYRVKFGVVDDFAAHRYAVPGGFQRSFPIPQLAVPTQDLVVRKDGVPAALQIRATTGPLILSWKVTELPAALQLSKMEGAGDATIEVYATDKAVPSPIPQLIRINTVPATSADALRSGSIAVKVVVAG